MPLLATSATSAISATVRRCVSAAFVLALALPEVTRAQVALTHTEDAAPLPAGMLRVRVTTGWSRFDERFTASGRRSLDAELSTDSLGPRQLAGLGPAESAFQTLTNNPATRLTLGRLAATRGVRTVTTPIALEYGLTRRLTLGVMVPVVQTRGAIHVGVNQDSARLGNTTFVQPRNRGTAAAANRAVFTALTSASDSLATLLSRCPTNPAASGCAAVNANPADAGLARQQARDFADAIQRALGADSATSLLAPKTGSALALAIDARRTAVNAQLQKYLGGGAGAATSVFTSASDFSYIDLQGRGTAPGLLQSTLGGGLDSIRTVNRLAIAASVTIGAQYLLFDGFQYDSLPKSGLQTRVSIGGAYRYSPIGPDSAQRLGSVSAGDGNGVVVRSAMDLIRGNLGGTIGARFEKSFAQTVIAPQAGDPEAFFPFPGFGTAQRTAGSVLALDFTPRYFFGEWIAIDGHYGLERTGAVTYTGQTVESCAACAALNTAGLLPGTSRVAQRLGFGLRYSTVDSYLRGRARTPIEISFTHLETIAGGPGVAAISRDQIHVRLFLRLRGR